jgi:hypothetical protein
MNDLGTLCILGFIILLALFLIPRLFGGNPYAQRGSEYPQYDDPDIQSRSGIGRRSFFPRSRGSERPTYNSPDIQSRSGFGGSSVRSKSSGGARRYDSPNIQSRSGFGGSKK